MTAPRPRLVSKAYAMGSGPAPSADEVAERTRRIKAAIWHKLGWAVIDPAEIDNEWLRQAVTSEAERAHGAAIDRRGREAGMMQRHKVGEYGRVRRVMDVVSLVEWAFRDECAQLELPSQVDAEDRPRGYGLEFVLIQRAMLGTQIDGGGSSEPAHDADVVAAVVANLSEGSGGRRMAASIAEMARASMTPDWMPDAAPRVVPRAWQKQLRHGRMYAQTEVCGTVEYRGGPKAGGRMIRREVTWCPVTITPTAQQIAAARRFYLQWWGAMLEIQVGLAAAEGLMDSHAVSDAMPPVAPWRGGRT